MAAWRWGSLRKVDPIMTDARPSKRAPVHFPGAPFLATGLLTFACLLRFGQVVRTAAVGEAAPEALG